MCVPLVLQGAKRSWCSTELAPNGERRQDTRVKLRGPNSMSRSRIRFSPPLDRLGTPRVHQRLQSWSCSTLYWRARRVSASPAPSTPTIAERLVAYGGKHSKSVRNTVRKDRASPTK